MNTPSPEELARCRNDAAIEYAIRGYPSRSHLVSCSTHWRVEEFEKALAEVAYKTDAGKIAETKETLLKLREEYRQKIAAEKDAAIHRETQNEMRLTREAMIKDNWKKVAAVAAVIAAGVSIVALLCSFL